MHLHCVLANILAPNAAHLNRLAYAFVVSIGLDEKNPVAWGGGDSCVHGIALPVCICATDTGIDVGTCKGEAVAAPVVREADINGNGCGGQEEGGNGCVKPHFLIEL